MSQKKELAEKKERVEELEALERPLTVQEKAELTELEKDIKDAE